MPEAGIFQLEADDAVQAWLDSHPSPGTRVIAYDIKGCCGGAKICSVRVREHSPKDVVDKFATAILEDGTRFLVHPAAAARLPSRFGLTLRGLGPLRHLDLDLDSEQWGALLYD